MQRVEVQLEDDLTGGPADETVEFGVGGRYYELDLSARHAADFRHLLAPFVEHARPASGHRSRTPARTSASRERSREIRAWAEQQGIEISERGRLPGNVIEQYSIVHSTDQVARTSGRRSAPRPVAKKQARAGRTARHRAGRRAG
jgi:Lsr2